LTAPAAARTLTPIANKVLHDRLHYRVRRQGRPRPGSQALLAELFVELDMLPGFLSKETFDDVDRPGRRITISYWTDADALRGWMLNAAHIRAISLGKREIFSHYNIKIATVERETEWTALAEVATG
jgi:heme-degrading monooxygenase HmoA